jgi:hypothetical protein
VKRCACRFSYVSGHHARLTRVISPVRSWAETSDWWKNSDYNFLSIDNKPR